MDTRPFQSFDATFKSMDVKTPPAVITRQPKVAMFGLKPYTITATPLPEAELAALAVAMESAAAIEKVPWDVLFIIAQHLQYRDVMHLAMTSRAMRRFVKPKELVSDEETRRFHLEAERFDQHRDRLTCFICMKLRPLSCFGDGMRNGPRGKWGHARDLAATRFCWDCGASKRLYKENQAIRKGRFLWYLCHQCGVWKHKSQRCPKVGYVVNDDFTAERCNTTHYKTVCSSQWPASRPSRLETVLRRDSSLQANIVSHLGYRDLLSLAATNHHFRATVRPLDAPYRDKAAVVKKADELIWKRAHPALYRAADPTVGVRRDDVLDRTSRACLVCFRMRPSSKFGSPQIWVRPKPGTSGWWKHPCKACGIQMAKEDKSEEWTRRAANFRRLDTCWVCRELKYKDETCPSCEEKGPRWDKYHAVRGERARRKKQRQLLDPNRVDGESDADDGEGQEAAATTADDVASEPVLFSLFADDSWLDDAVLESATTAAVTGPDSVDEDFIEAESSEDEALGPRVESFQARFEAGTMSEAEKSLYRRLQASMRAMRARRRLRLEAYANRRNGGGSNGGSVWASFAAKFRKELPL